MKKFITKNLIVLLCGIILLSASGCSSKCVTKQVYSMDTVITLTIYGNNADDAIISSTNIIDTLDEQFDPNSQTSEVYYINSLEGKNRSVSDEVVEMYEIANEIYQNTNGALDLSVLPLSKLWGFLDLNNNSVKVPSDAEISETLSHVDFSKVSITDNVISIPSDMQISFNAIAKGYCSNKICSTIRNMGVSSAVISLGSDVQTIGLKPNGDKWTVAIEDPDSVGNYVGTVQVAETAVATSGGYQKAFIDDGKTYGHILDPKTGYPAESGLKSVTVICRDGALADALSTALYVLGKDAAIEYWRQYSGFEMIMITDNNRIFCTSGLESSFTTVSDSKYPVTYVD